MLTANVYAYLGGAWVDITSDVLDSPGVSYSGGIKGNKDKDRIAGAGALSFTLKNNTGDYTPGSGTAHADWKKGTPIKVTFSKGSPKTKFIGKVDTIDNEYAFNEIRASITALDWMHFAAQLPLDIPALQTSKTADQIITTILGLSPIQPEGVSLQTGTTTFPYAFHDNTTKTTAYTEISKATLSEWGYFYEKLDGTLVFEKYNGRASTQKQVDVITTRSSGFLLKEDGGYLLKEDGGKIILEDYDSSLQDAELTTIDGINIQYGKHITNRVELQVYPYKPGGEDVLVYTNEKNQSVPAGQTVSFRTQFLDKNSRQPIAAIAPVEKQYTLLHFEDNTALGITGVLDDADLNVLNQAADTFYYPKTFFQANGGSTTAAKFGDGFSGDGVSDYIYSPSQEKFNVRAGDFTIDWWEYRNSATAGAAMISRNTAGGFAPYVLGMSDAVTSRVYMTSTGASWDIANGKSLGTITTGTWVHYAVVRSGNTFITFQNGVIQDVWVSSATILTSASAIFSILKYGAAYVNGTIDEFRLIKGYAAWTTTFTPPSKAYTMSGLNWSLHTGERKTGTDITSSATISTSFGGAGTDVIVTSSSGSDGYLTLEIYAQPLESISPIPYIKEDLTSIAQYGYFSERIDMRLRGDVLPAQTIADAIVTARKDPASVIMSVSAVANKSDYNEAIFLDCDIGDLIRVNDSLSSYNGLNYIQAISWNATPGDGAQIVRFSFELKEQ